MIISQFPALCDRLGHHTAPLYSCIPTTLTPTKETHMDSYDPAATSAVLLSNIVDPKILARRERQRRYRERKKAQDPKVFAEHHREEQRRYHERNRDAINTRQREQYANRSEEQKAAERDRKNAYRRERYLNDPLFREQHRQSQLLRRHLKGVANSERFGYSNSELRQHLESQFKPWMTWDNYGTDWELDHIRPISSFLADGITDPAVISALENLRPLSGSENKRKGARYEPASPALRFASGSVKFDIAKPDSLAA